MNNPIRIDTRPEPKYRDTLFRMIFGGKDEKSARWRMELYNALSGRKHTNPADLELTTIENVIYITMKNDISFLVDSQMTLYEHQSTVNLNMPLRGLMYFAQLYQIYLTKKGKDLFGGLVKIPTPQYVVFYNGDTNKPARYKIKLSEAFDFPSENETTKNEKIADYEWTANVININSEHNKTLQNNCKPLYDYISYVNRVKVNQKSGMDIKSAVNEAVNWAINKNLLAGFFNEQKAEVTAMSLTEFDQELYDKNRREEAYEEGARDKAIEAAKTLLCMNVLTIEQIAQAEKLSIDEVNQLAIEIQKDLK